jgi:hypothetical protein
LTNKLASLNRSISNKLSARLAIIAGLSGLIYGVVFTLRFPLARFYHTIPPVDYTKLTHYSLSGLIVYMLGLGMLFGLYVWAIRLSGPTGKPSRPEQSPSLLGSQHSVIRSLFIFLSSAILAVISIFSYPLTAIDLFVYAIWTRGWGRYGLNPLATAPETFPNTDPWPGLAGEWIDATSPYGSLWELLSLGAFYLGGGDFLSHLFALKVLATLAYLGCVWLVYKILQQLRPEWAVAGTIAFAWNPLVLLESVQNGHNDIVMVFFLLAAIWVFVKWSIHHRAQKKLTVAPSLLLTCLLLALSILVKFVMAIIVPFFLIGMVSTQSKWGHRLVSMTLYGLVTAGLVGLAMLPLWPGWTNWAVLKTSSGAGRSLLALLVLALRDSLGPNTAIDISRNLILSIFALIYLYYLWQMIIKLRHIQPTSPVLALPPASSPIYAPISAAFFTLFWYVLLVAPVFHAWYLLWSLPLAALLTPYRRPLIAAIVFSITALLVIPYFETIRIWYPILLHNPLLGHLFGVPLLIGPPAIAILWPISPPDNSKV